MVHIYYTLLILCQFLTAHANIPYVHGVDYLPEHYNGYIDDINENLFNSDGDIENDFFRMSQNFDALRTYEYDPINLQRILRAAKRYQMKVVVGVKTNPSDDQYTNYQVSGINRMFVEYPDLLTSVIAIVVDDENLEKTKNSAKDVEYLMKQYNTILKYSWFQNAKIDLAVSTTSSVLLSDTGSDLLKKLPNNAPVFVSINPYMTGCTINAAIAEVNQNVDNSCPKASFPSVWKQVTNSSALKNHQIIVDNTGWPTDGPGAKTPVKIINGSLSDAVQYYQFLYPFLKKQPILVPYFIFSAFDEPMNGAFGFSSNFWGVYNFDSSPKNGMEYPLNRTVTALPKLGTNIRISLPKYSSYNLSKIPVLFQTNQNVYSSSSMISNTVWDLVNSKNKPSQSNLSGNKKLAPKTIFSFIDDFPYVKYSSNGSNIVILILPDGKDNNHPAATCTNELISGNGYGFRDDMTLKWKYAHSKETNCSNINWANNGVWIN